MFGRGCLFEGDGEAEGFELALEASGAVLDRVALALPVRPELAVGNSVFDDVVVGDHEVVADRAECLGLTAPTAKL